MLLESYAAGATVEPLAHFYKERIWRGDAAVDSSALLDEAIAAYCNERDDLERLALGATAAVARSGNPRWPTTTRERAREHRTTARASKSDSARVGTAHFE